MHIVRRLTIVCVVSVYGLILSAPSHSEPPGEGRNDGDDVVGELEATLKTGTSEIAKKPAKVDQATVTALNDFAFRLHHTMASGQNLVYSPYSIFEGLALAQLGARGETKVESSKVLGVAAIQDFPRKMGALAQSLRKRGTWTQGDSVADRFFGKEPLSLTKKSGGELVVGRGAGGMGLRGIGTRDPNYKPKKLEFQVANDLWIDRGLKLRGTFASRAKRYYGARVAELELDDRPHRAAKTINAHVAKVTHGLIPKLIEPSSLRGNVPLVQTNAVYFQGSWEHEFPSDATKQRTFTVSRDKTKKVPMMHLSRSFDFVELDEAKLKAVELPYEGGPISAIVVLPTKGTLDELEKRLDAKVFAKLLGSLRSTLVDLQLPKFELRDRTLVDANLKQLGLKRIYEPRKANLSGIADTDLPLFIKADVHAAFIHVDEQKTLAAAGFGRIAGLGAIAPPKKVIFHADRPFLFFIVDKPTGAILFVSRVVDPTNH